MRVLITGARGFIGKNLKVRLEELGGYELIEFNRGQGVGELRSLVAQADMIVHLAGENRPADPAAFIAVNSVLTSQLCDAVRATGRMIPVIMTSSIQAEHDSPYGASKRAGEQALEGLVNDTGTSCTIFRLPNVFGKWSRPNYNSAVATFCHNLARDLPIRIDNPAAVVRLAYIDDVLDAFVSVITSARPGLHHAAVTPEHTITVGELAATIRGFVESRSSLITDRVGCGLTRALYATYISFLPTAAFAYEVTTHRDPRGVFVEMLKTPDCGQFSYFTAHPGVTRGGHYHHTKSEKFLVLSGTACFRFRHLVTDECYELTTEGSKPVIVETIPGWAHDITNVGKDELIVMLWANEIFDRQRPDTFARSV